MQNATCELVLLLLVWLLWLWLPICYGPDKHDTRTKGAGRRGIKNNVYGELNNTSGVQQWKRKVLLNPGKVILSKPNPQDNLIYQTQP